MGTTGMQVTFLGTAASGGYPNAFCGCDNCEAARALGGPSLRKRSSALINDDLLIDLGPDLIAAAQQHGVSLASLRYCVQTHVHQDRLDPLHFLSRAPNSGVTDIPRLAFYASAGALTWVAQHVEGRLPPDGITEVATSERMNLTTHVITPFQPFTVGPYTVTSVRAAHDPALVALLHIIERNGRTLLYATDTGPFPDATWAALRAGGWRFNLVAMDHTFGWLARATGHQNAAQFREQCARMRDAGVLADDARVYATHIAHHANPPHPALVTRAAQAGYFVSYDGLTVTV